MTSKQRLVNCSFKDHEKTLASPLAGIILLLALLAQACAGKPPMLLEPVESSWIIDAPLETLWQSGVVALVEKGVEIDILDKEAGLIVVVDHFGGNSFGNYVADLSTFYGGEARTNILFIPEGQNQTRLTIKPTLLGWGRSPVPLEVASNGKLERGYYMLIAESLPRDKTYEWLEDSEL
jgi:hypothetical protein